MTLGEPRFEIVLSAARAGAEWALGSLYREFQPPILRYFRAQEPADAEDLASEVWLDVASGLERFEGDEASFRRWLFTIARRRVLDVRRKAARRQTDVFELEWFANLASSDDPETEVLAAASAREALAQIAALPRDQAEVVLLRVLAGLSVEDVATVMGKRPGTVRVLQHRALRRLADALAQTAVTK